MTRALAMGMVAVMAAAGAAKADILWNQPVDVNAPVGFRNSVSPGFNGGVIFGVSDVSVPAGGWTIQSVSTYFSALTWFDGSVTSAVLNVFPKTGSLPLAANDPRANPTGNGTSVPVSMINSQVQFNGVWEIQASGLNIALTPGEYWVGLTPVGPTGNFGPDAQWGASGFYGVGQRSREFSPNSGWFDHSQAFGSPQTDGAIQITGIPAPSSLALLGVGGLLASRRRR